MYRVFLSHLDTYITKLRKEKNTRKSNHIYMDIKIERISQKLLNSIYINIKVEIKFSERVFGQSNENNFCYRQFI